MKTEDERKPDIDILDAMLAINRQQLILEMRKFWTIRSRRRF